MEEAERIAREEHKSIKMAVISGQCVMLIYLFNIKKCIVYKQSLPHKVDALSL